MEEEGKPSGRRGGRAALAAALITLTGLLLLSALLLGLDARHVQFQMTGG